VLKQLVDTVVPKALHPATLAKRRVLRLSSGKVLAGPFAGMLLVRPPDTAREYAMLLGTYEMELRDAIERICATPPDLIVDVGSADGYYSVGLAMRCSTSTRVIAFEKDEAVRERATKLATANNVASRIEFRGRCDLAALNDALAAFGRKLLLVDLGGGERELLDPNAVPAMSSCEIIAEMHASRVADIDELMESRFRPTHQLVMHHPDARSDEDLPPQLAKDWNPWTASLMSEHKPGSSGWYHMVPRGVD
jgi:hypothetical protein